MDRVFPGLDSVELWPNHDIFYSFFSIEEKPRAPGIVPVTTGIDGENGACMDDARIRGLIDSNGRLMAVFCHNMDLGDAWEHADHAEYP